jgi:hypothetical protein
VRDRPRIEVDGEPRGSAVAARVGSLQRRAIGVELDAVLQAPDLDEVADSGLERLVRLREGRDLQYPFQVGDTRYRAVAAQLEETLVVRPRRVPEDRDVVLETAVVTLGRTAGQYQLTV